MKKCIIFPLLLIGLFGFGQMQVKCDSIIEKHGQYAKLSGLVMGSKERIFFVFHWVGLGKIELLNQWFTIHERKRYFVITKN